MSSSASIRLASPLHRVSLRIDGVSPAANKVSTSAAAAPAVPAISQRAAELLEVVLDEVGELERRRQRAWDELQELAVEVAIAVAGRVTRMAIDADQFGVDAMVREMLATVGDAQPVRVQLHPDDLRVLREVIAAAPHRDEALVEFCSDPTLERGECRAVSGSRSIISDWRTQLNDIRGVIHEELEHAQVERRGSQAADQRVKRFPDRRETA